MRATIINTGNLRIRAASLLDGPWGTSQPACTLFTQQFSAGWAPGADIPVGCHVECESSYTLNDTDLQQASLAPGGTLQVQLPLTVQASVGQALAPISNTTRALVHVMAEPSVSITMDPATCAAGELASHVHAAST